MAPARSRRPSPRAPEREIQSGILRAAEALGLVLHPTDAGAIPRASRGLLHGTGAPRKDWPDTSGYVPGLPHRYAIPLFVEAKRPGARPRPGQQACLDRLAAHGCLANWFDDIAQAAEWFRWIRQEVMK